jgi:radical SAM superfamily enzyme YgiQ (UPF0313 family)
MYKKTALISLPKQDLLRPPGALSILAAACDECHVDYEVFDFNLWLYRNIPVDIWTQIDNNWHKFDPLKDQQEEFYLTFKTKLKEYVDLVLDSNPDLISISVFTDESAACALELIKELNIPNRPYDIVIGGSGIRAHLATVTDQDFCQYLLKEKLIEYFLYGEGEIVFRKVLSKDFNYGGINNFDADQIENLDQFPFPSYKKINPYDYEFAASPELIVTGSRGCVRKCTYCDVANYWPKFRYRSGQNIADEMYFYHKTVGIARYEFSDSLINGSLKSFKEMNQALVKYKEQDPTFKPSYKGQFICRPSIHMKEDDYKTAKEAGCDYIYVGVETFSDKVRHDMKKKFNNIDLDYHLDMCGKYNIANSFLMFVGYPTETLADHKENLKYLLKYQKYAQAGVITLITFGYTASILKGTPLDIMREQMNIVDEYEGFSYEANWVSMDNPTLTLKERIRRWVELVELSQDLNYLQPRVKMLISRYQQMLDAIKNKRSFIPINADHLSQEYLVK